MAMFKAAFAVSVAIAGGAVLSADTPDGRVTVSMGKIIDWRSVKCGEEIACDPGDEGIAFAAMVGEECALAAAAERGPTSALPTPDLHVWPEKNGDQTMGFSVGAFDIKISRNWGSVSEWSSEAQREFAAALSRAALEVQS